MTLIIPGVEVKVVKEVLPPQLAPSGILGLVGMTEKIPAGGVGRAKSWNRFVELFGAASAYSMPEAAQALANGVSELVVVPLNSATKATYTLTWPLALRAYYEIKDTTGGTITIIAKEGGTAGNAIKFEIKNGDNNKRTLILKNAEADIGRVDIELKSDKLIATPYSKSIEIKINDTSVPEPQNGESSTPVVCEIRIETNSPPAVTTETNLTGGVDARESNVVCKLKSKIPGAKGNNLKILPKWNKILGSSFYTCNLAVYFDDKQIEIHRNLTKENFADVLNASSTSIAVVEDSAVNFYTFTFDEEIGNNNIHSAQLESFKDGRDSENNEWSNALNKLKDEPDVDMVMASIPLDMKTPDAQGIYTAINSHCLAMSAKSQGRIGFAQVLGNSYSEDNGINNNADALAKSLVSERMVLVAPAHATGAVAGMIGSLDYFQSPTFKPVAIPSVSPVLGVEEQEALLKQHIVPIVSYRGRGIIVLRGLTSDGDQISVRRVADHAVRGVKSIGELFIGRLNNEDGRGALKQNLVAFLMQMEKEGAIVPSTDGSDPAFKVNVYSSQTDFAQGIVRIDMAVRPVRAIDFIYATVLVQV